MGADPQSAASQGRLYRPSFPPGSLAARVAVQQGKYRCGTAQPRLALRYAVRSDVGGHAAGEVASATAITTIAPLDAKHLELDLVDALADAVATANLRLRELILSDPAIEGMGNTLTALLWSEQQRGPRGCCDRACGWPRPGRGGGTRPRSLASRGGR